MLQSIGMGHFEIASEHILVHGSPLAFLEDDGGSACLLRLLRRRVCQLETSGPSTRVPASRLTLTTVVRLVELGEAGVVSLASTPPSSLLRLSARRQSLGQARYPVRRRIMTKF